MPPDPPAEGADFCTCTGVLGMVVAVASVTKHIFALDYQETLFMTAPLAPPESNSGCGNEIGGRESRVGHNGFGPVMSSEEHNQLR